MSHGLTTTFQLLGKTPNEAASRILIPAMDSPVETIRQMALRALLSRRCQVGQREVIGRLDRLDEESLEIVRNHGGRMAPALRAAILGSDPRLCANACQAALWLREYDLIPALVSALEDQANPNADLAARTLLGLIEALEAELSSPDQPRGGRDPHRVRDRVVGALERSAGRFGRHRRREIVEALVRLVKRDNATLKLVLKDPHHPAFVVLMDVLGKSTSDTVVRLLLSYLDDARAPSAVPSLVAKRRDPKFVRYLLRKIGREPSSAVRKNLKRMRSIAWAADGAELLDELDDAAQHSAVRMVVLSATTRQRAFALVEHVLLHGKPGGRRAASEALAQFNGAEANRLTLRCLDDPDPLVQAKAVAQLRGRGIPGALARLVEMIDSRHAVVRRAVRRNLTEFTFARFLAEFDSLDDDVRLSTGELVKRVDPQALAGLEAELQSRIRSRRLRGLAMATGMDVVPQLEEPIMRLLGEDEEHMVRAQAASALEYGQSPTSLDALRGALRDSSITVQEAAADSLRQRAGRAGELVSVSSPATSEEEAQ